MKPAAILPPDAVRKLQAAASIEPEKPAGESDARSYALNKTIAAVRAYYPEFFKYTQGSTS